MQNEFKARCRGRQIAGRNDFKISKSPDYASVRPKGARSAGLTQRRELIRLLCYLSISLFDETDYRIWWRDVIVFQGAESEAKRAETIAGGCAAEADCG